MKFFLNYTPHQSKHSIHHSNTLLLMGSCFAENIGQKFKEHQFKTYVNPNGVLFNPSSIYNTITNCLQQKEIDQSSIINTNGLFFSFEHHTSIYSTSKSGLESSITDTQNKFYAYLKETDLLFITFGTAFVYKRKLNNCTAANCHKQSSSEFEKSLMSVNDITSDYIKLISQLKNLNPKLKIIFTVSPVKYLKDGVEENSLSKATLLLAVSALTKAENCDYFPAYELINDDLRDYRFYKADMAHPNEQAINYVWEKFSHTYFAKETIELNKELATINQSENHKLLFPESEEAKKFMETLEHKKRELKTKFSFLKF